MDGQIFNLALPINESIATHSANLSSTLIVRHTFVGNLGGAFDLYPKLPVHTGYLNLSPILIFAVAASASLLILSFLGFIKTGKRSGFHNSVWSDAATNDKNVVLRPPVVHIPNHILFSAEGHEAYSNALDKHGDVVVVPRHGRMEYVLDIQHVKDVLCDAQNFSFEKAVTNMLHMEPLMWFKNGTFVQELDKLVQEGITPRLPSVIETIAPIFARESEDLLYKFGTDGKHAQVDDLYDYIHETIGRAMIVLILGDQYLNEENTRCFMNVVAGIADFSGMYANTSWWAVNFPRIWTVVTTVRAVVGTILPQFYFGLIPLVWRNLQMHTDAGLDAERGRFTPFIELLAAKHVDRGTGTVGFLNFLWISTVALGVIFASIHQSAVVACWCVMGLALRPEYVEEIREEIDSVLEIDDDGNRVLTAEGLRNAEKLDSFIREVMRTKGDTFAPLRWTTAEVKVGKYTIPKGALVTPYVKRIHEHPVNYGSKGTTFDGRQWVGTRPAVMGSPEFVSFGLGRWACPGRHLAVMELKMIMATLFDRYDIRLQGDSYDVVDPMNATSRSPEAVTLFTARVPSALNKA